MMTGIVYPANVYHKEDKYGEITRKLLENGESIKETKLAIKKAEREDELKCLQAIKKGKVLKEIAPIYNPNLQDYRRREDPSTIYLYEDIFYQISYEVYVRKDIRPDTGIRISTLGVRCLIDDNFAN
jgi:hypothetical protein